MITCESLIQIVRDEASDDEKRMSAASAFLQKMSATSSAEIDDALRALAAHFDSPIPAHGALLALICGALIEYGANPDTIAASLTWRLHTAFAAAAELADACAARIPTPNEDDEVDEDDFDRVRGEISATEPRLGAEWDALNQLWRPAVAVYSRSARARSAATTLQPLATRLAPVHEAGHWLKMLLAVLDKEPILAIEPATRLGIEGRFSGIVDNFQLNTLLMDEFPLASMFSRRRVSKRIADTARGLGPQQTDDTVMGFWNLYAWTAILPNLQLPEAGDQNASERWIWNEGNPQDIPQFEGNRVVLLGPPSYARSWRSQRMFTDLSASIEITKKLSTAESIGALKRMVAAKQ